MVYLTKRDHIRRLRKRKVINGGSLWDMIKNVGGKVLPYLAPAAIGWLASKFFGKKDKDTPSSALPAPNQSPAGLDMGTLLELIKTNPQLASMLTKAQNQLDSTIGKVKDVYSDIYEYVPKPGRGPKPRPAGLPIPTIEEKMIDDEEREIDGHSVLSKKSLKKLVKGSGLLKYHA